MKLMAYPEQSRPLGLQPDDFGFLPEGAFLVATADETTPNLPNPRLEAKDLW